MALQDAILVALAAGECSGYDLSKAFDISVANFWAATPQQLYRELDKLESAGLITARVVEQSKRPNKRLLSLTEAGHEALRQFTARTPKPIAIRDELLVQVEGVEFGDGEQVRGWIEARLKTAQRKLALYLHGRDLMLDGQSEAEFLGSAERIGPYLTLARGIAFERENVDWCQFSLCALEQRTR